jgi:hypothetical protein
MTSKFNQNLLNWARENPDDPLSAYLIENYKESSRIELAEKRKWQLIHSALKNYESRPIFINKPSGPASKKD